MAPAKPTRKAATATQAKASKASRTPSAPSTSKTSSPQKKSGSNRKNVKSKDVVEDSDIEEAEAPAPPSTPPPQHGRSLRKRPAPVPETPSKALQSLSLQSPMKKAKRGSAPSPVPALGSPFVEKKARSTSANNGVEDAQRKASKPVKAGPAKSTSPKKASSRTKRHPVEESDGDDFVVPDEEEEDAGDAYEPEEDDEGTVDGSEPEAVATDGEEVEDDDIEGNNSVDDVEVEYGSDGSDVEMQAASDDQQHDDDEEEEGGQDDGDGSVAGSEGEEDSEAELYEPGSFFPKKPTSREPVLEIDSLKDPNAPEGVYPGDLCQLRPGSIESRTDNEATNILPSAIRNSLPQVKDSVIWRHIVWAGSRNNVNLARAVVGSVGSRAYERENTELIVRGRGTAICVVFGLVQESNLYSPRLWNGNTPGEKQEFVSFNILVNPFTFERQRIMAHTVMAMNNWSMRSTEHKGGLNLTTLSAKIGTPTTKKKEPNAFFDLTANMVNTASAGYGTVSPRRYTEKVPVYDATNIEDFDIDNHIDDLSGTLPTWPEGKEIPILSLVVAGYTVRHSLGTNSNKWLMNTYIQWLVVIADKDQAAAFAVQKSTKAKPRTPAKTSNSAASTKHTSRTTRKV